MTHRDRQTQALSPWLFDCSPPLLFLSSSTSLELDFSLYLDDLLVNKHAAKDLAECRGFLEGLQALIHLIHEAVEKLARVLLLAHIHGGAPVLVRPPQPLKKTKNTSE